MTQIDSVTLAREIRMESVRMVSRVNASHIGGVMSMADVLGVLYGEILNLRPEEPKWPDRNRFILSKGHCCAGVYAALCRRGFFTQEALDTYGQNGSPFMTHISHKVPGVEFSTGSLGHGLGFGCGKALAAKRKKEPWRVYVMLSDGELDEGSNWEAFLFAPQHKLDNLVAIIDYNKIQSLGSVAEVMELGPLADKFRAFRWGVKEVDGHDHNAIREALKTTPWEPGKPSCLIAHTTKGKGVDYMENKLLWHYRSPDKQLLEQALKQLNCGA